MVDRVYKSQIPRLRKKLDDLREGFSKLHSGTDWTRLRVEPLLTHAEALEHLLESPEFSQEFSRLTRGVKMFHSDLVYLRTNLDELERICLSQSKRRPRKLKVKKRKKL
jgi:hypothetical protein